MEIDYEKSSNPNLTGLQQFVTAYRSLMPYDPTGNNYAARLTIDLGNDDLFLQPLSAYATTNWLNPSNPVLDYANALVASQKTTVSTPERNHSPERRGNHTGHDGLHVLGSRMPRPRHWLNLPSDYLRAWYGSRRHNL